MKRKQQFVASDWLPLNAAFVRIGDSVGSPALAASDLHYALLGGLPSAYRSQEATAKHTTANCHRIFGGNLR
jgi:hypothetical protein